MVFKLLNKFTIVVPIVIVFMAITIRIFIVLIPRKVSQQSKGASPLPSEFYIKYN